MIRTPSDPIAASPVQPAGASVDPAEIARFAAIAAEWWNPNGKFRPLHKLNPVRLAYVRAQAEARFGRDARDLAPLRGLRLLDIGCGGGLLSEPMARLGAEVVGVDAAENNVRIAALHATQSGLAIDYRCTTAEALVADGEMFDIVLGMEVVEHVADLDGFLTACADLLKPGGLMLLATLNRTLKAWALAVVGAEYVLGWLPRGTHDWSRFVRPSELARPLRRAGLRITDVSGVEYDVLADAWRLTRTTDVNYLVAAVRD